MSLTLREVSRKLARTTRNARTVWRERTSILVELADELGNRGLGEASPLPGYSPDDLETNRAALGALDIRALELDPDLPIRQLLAAVGGLVGSHARAARFALETAFIDLLGNRLKKPAWELLAARTPPSVPLASLLDAPEPEARNAQADRAYDRGIRTFKVKLDRSPGEVEWLGELRRRMGAHVMLRLDANQVFEAAEAARILPILAEISPEFLEEPVADFELAATRAELWHSSPIPLALDESLQRPSSEKALRARDVPRSVRVLVLKPTALGGWARCLTLAELGRELGLGVVVSHTFEGPVAWAALASLALCIQSPGFAAGLDRHAGLDAWPATTPATIETAEIVPASAPGLGLGPARVW
jgi:L-Ala-D/L-Glu epimerase